MTLRSEFQKLLACPRCKGELEHHEGENELWCLGCSLAFPVKDDIPVMLVDEARSLEGCKPP